MEEKGIPLINVEQNEYVNNITVQSSPNPGRTLQPSKNPNQGRTLHLSPRPERSFASTKRNPGYVTLDRNTENGLYLHPFRFNID